MLVRQDRRRRGLLAEVLDATSNTHLEGHFAIRPRQQNTRLIMVQLSSLAVVMCFLATMATTTSAATTIRSVAAADPVDCRVGEFCPWSKCDPLTKTKTRTRTIVQAPKGKGKPCPAVVETEACKPDPESAAKRAGEIPKGGLALVVIDQQVDFHPGGSLAIPTANEDAERIAAFINKHADDISQLVFTLDSHQRYHIAHGIFWTNDAGVSPDPFTAITHQDVANGLWKPRDETLKDYVLAYTSALESNKKFVLNIWPEHCIIGTPGHNIVSNVHAAALEWAKKKKRGIQYVLKGTNSFTEHYSALRAEYELSYDPATKLNQGLIDNLAKASKVAIVGEALSHCVNYSVRDLVANWPASRRKDLYLFTDCSSVVPGFEDAGKQFVADMKTAGLNVIESTEYEA